MRKFRPISPQTADSPKQPVLEFADVYKERHVFAKSLAIGKTIIYRLKLIIDYFGDKPLAEIRTADVEDFIADLSKPRIAGRRKMPRTLSPPRSTARSRSCGT